MECLPLFLYFKKLDKLYGFAYLGKKPLLKPRHLSILVNNYILWLQKDSTLL